MKNPGYAGACVFGRYTSRYISRRTVDPSGTVHTAITERPRAEWPVLIKDHHEGYITWAKSLASEARLAANHTAASARPPRDGTALCQGIISCGKPLMTNCHTDQRPAYNSGSRRDQLTTPSCRSVAAACVDAAAAGALLNALTPGPGRGPAPAGRVVDEPLLGQGPGRALRWCPGRRGPAPGPRWSRCGRWWSGEASNAISVCGHLGYQPTLYSACGTARCQAISNAATMSRMVRGSELKV